MNIRRLSVSAVFLFLIIAFSRVESGAIITPPGKSYVKVYYFHGDRRCKTCLTIEKYSKNSVKSNFDKPIEDGDLVMDIINFEKDENEYYIEKFDLFNQALVLARFDNGRMKEWKNLPKIWEYSGDQAKFEKYVVNEIEKYLKKL